MDDYIKREDAIREAIEAVDEYDGGYVTSRDDLIAAYINDIHAADVRENVRGEWVNYSEYDTRVRQRFNRWLCSNCGKVRKRGWENTSDGKKPLSKFCENCGAEMRGDI